MGTSFHRFLTFFYRNFSVSVLAIVCLASLVLGTFLGIVSNDSYFLLMRMAASCRVSIVGLISTSFLPFLFSAFAVYIGKQKLIYLVVFLRMLLFAWGAVGTAVAFQTAGWLVHFLLQFTDILLLPVLCWFSLRQLTEAGVLRKDLSLCTATFLLVGSLDFCVVSPFLVMLIDI